MLELLYGVSAVGSGLVLVAEAMVGTGRSRLGWALVGGGVLCWGLGEVALVILSRAGEILI